ncbi:hypothetical protein MLIT_32870 [Mycolicibacterium litorale]|uniref:Uncharacterized protein n=1 Tax=Mycolicibacterium litorale TaxID=758802 RepID=A0AAD1IL27_9MYCO|nr:hypothetical protein MLIT_32870 [Mycolicibacterium litorale]
MWYYNGLGNAEAIAGEQITTDLSIPRTQWFPAANPHDRNDYRDNGRFIFNYVFYDSEIRVGQPHLRSGAGSFAWLNNNPGNLTGHVGGPDFGQYIDKFNWHNFLIFPDYATGFTAIGAFLRQGIYPPLSILEAFRRYAPASDGNTPDVYAADVAAAAGVPMDTPVGDLGDDQMYEMQLKIAQIEGTVEGTTYAYNSPDLPPAIQALVSEL